MERERIYRDILENLSVPKGLTNEEAWNKLQGRLSVNDTPTKVVPMWRKLAWVSSAAAAVVLVAWFMFGGNQSQEFLSEDRTKQVELPDGSVVSLNKYSSVAFNADSWDKERTVELKGEAFFEVEKGSEFTVRTSKGEVRVLGTSFNVFARDEFFDVACFTGKVGVKHNEQDVVLVPGEATRILDSKLSAAFEVDYSAPDWKEKKFYFEDGTSMKRVFAEIEKEFDVTIEYTGDTKLNGILAFEIDSLEKTMEVVCASSGLKFEIKDRKVSVSGN